MTLAASAASRGAIAAAFAAAAGLMPAPARPAAAPAEAPGVACLDSPLFRVAVRDRVGALGIDIVAAPRTPGSGPVPCGPAGGAGAYSPDADAAGVLALKGRFLALDVGTGPDRDIRIYDLATRAKLVDVPYDDGRFAASDAAFVYWRVGPEIHGGSCLAAYARRNGLRRQSVGHGLRQVSFSLGDGIARETGRVGCTVLQGDLT